MTPALRPRALTLFVGDIFFFIFALWISLYLRTFTAPTQEVFFDHLAPFSLLFVAWVVVFIIAGLYETRSIILQRRAISAALVWTQLVNIIIAALFFFFVPIFGIAPKTILFIYLLVSLVLVLLWRVVLYPYLGIQKPENALVVGKSKEVGELVHALHNARRAPTHIAAVIEPQDMHVAGVIKDAIAEFNPRFIIADFNDPIVTAAFPELYTFLSRGVRFLDAMTLYEEVFGRVPLSVINDRWLAQNVSPYSYTLYDFFKRTMDIVIATVVGVFSLLAYPFLIIAIKLYDGGPIFYNQIRTGEDNQPITMSKFRSMTGTDQGSEMLKTKHTVTPVGRIIRKTRIDEIPQLWSVFKGDMSLIGPRPEFPAMVKEYAQAIPYYNVRHLVRPGLSGWAQIYHDNHPHHGTEVEATREKLSYDLYYIKHRSLVLDLTIALKTIKKLLTRSGV